MNPTPRTPATHHALPHLPAGWVPAATRHAHDLRRQAIADMTDAVAGWARTALLAAWHRLTAVRRPLAVVQEQPCHS
ncbi:MAG: hypothetical protein IV093_03485 [Rubrivivax sp.]|nr:hypothetical protein [Rubrivivax sp.]